MFSLVFTWTGHSYQLVWVLLVVGGYKCKTLPFKCRLCRIRWVQEHPGSGGDPASGPSLPLSDPQSLQNREIGLDAQFPDLKLQSLLFKKKNTKKLS